VPDASVSRQDRGPVISLHRASPASRIARSLGVFSLLRRVHRHDLLVLVVHGVLPPREELPWIPLRDQIDVHDFEMQIDRLCATHRFVDLAQAIRILDGDESVDNPVLLTFDDGYRNNVDCALPILERRGIRPLLFVTTGYLDNARPFWFDRFDYAVQQLRSRWCLELGEQVFTFEPGSRERLKSVYGALRSHAKRFGWNDLQFHAAFSRWCDELENLTGRSLAEIQVNDPASATLGSPELRDVVARGALDVGSHTIDHLRIDKLDPAERQRQLVQSRQEIESIVGQPCVSFCYPNGDWNAESVMDVETSGYRLACTTDGGFNNHASARFALKRQFMPLTFDAGRIDALASGALHLKERLDRLCQAS
jgi:peptidoglycan/xylan/chitin deacetylase (PgdA/CDA1 family)